MRVLPWLIVGYILLAPPPKRAAASSRPSTSPPTRTVPRVAYLYRLPRDGYETTRVAVAEQPDDANEDVHPIEMGIFSNEAEALARVHSKGWALAWLGVKELEDRP